MMVCVSREKGINLYYYLSILNKQESSGKTEPYLKNMKITLICRQICGEFSGLMINVRELNPLWIVDSQSSSVFIKTTN